jgi:hypothetical protein
MTSMQRLCHDTVCATVLVVACAGTIRTSAVAEAPLHDYPTQARVEYVQECIVTHGNKLATLYQCSCAIDRIAAVLSYDDFIEASTFAKYATLPGEGGAIFRDSDRARERAKLYKQVEQDALTHCGIAK